MGGEGQAIGEFEYHQTPIVDHSNDTFAYLWNTSIKFTLPDTKRSSSWARFCYTRSWDFQTIFARGYGLPLLALIGSYRYLRMNCVNYDLVPDLPELIFSFGKGQAVTLTYDDYAMIFSLCIIAFDNAKQFTEIPDHITTPRSSFLQDLHSKWSCGNRIVRCM